MTELIDLRIWAGDLAAEFYKQTGAEHFVAGDLSQLPAGMMVSEATAQLIIDKLESEPAIGFDRHSKIYNLVVETMNLANALSDNPQATPEDVLRDAAKQERVHPRDVSFIMDKLSVRQCRALVNHQGFKPDASLTWAIDLGLITPDGAFTDKGKTFLGDLRNPPQASGL